VLEVSPVGLEPATSGDITRTTPFFCSGFAFIEIELSFKNDNSFQGMLYLGEEVRRIASISILALLIVTLFVLAFNTRLAKTEATTIVVPDDYPTIQGAINAANDEDTVFVRNGTYYENVTVNKTISLTGENKHNTIIDGGGSGTVLEVFHTSNVSLRDFTIRNGKMGLVLNEAGYTQMRNVSLAGSTYNFKFSEGPLWKHFCQDIDASNTIEGRPIYFWVNRQDETIHSDAGFVALINCSQITIQDLNLTNNWHGILAIELKDSLIKNIMISNTFQALSMRGVSNSVIQEIVAKNSGVGIILYHCDQNILSDNIVANNSDGIILQMTRNNTIERNTIINSSEYHMSTGIHLSYAHENKIVGNNIASNNCGIVLYESSNNSIYHNNFVDNNQQIVADGFLALDSWDNGCEGNYWNNYDGTDLDGDGVGDIYLPWEGVDYYPLVTPYWNPADVNHDLKVDIYDAVLVCAAYSSTPSNPHWNPHCDIAEPYGVIDIYDVVMICMSYGEEYLP